MYPKRKKTRLSRLEEKRSLKQASFFGLLTIVLIILLISIGIPGVIKLVTFLGDIRSSTQKVETSDSLPPPAPVLQSLWEATNSAQIKISGYSSEGLTVKLKINNIEVKETTAAKDGSFSFSGVALKKGENIIKTLAVNSLGKESESSQEQMIVLDQEAPSLEIIKPLEGDKFFDKEKQIQIEGKTDPEALVYINDRFTLADNLGNFSASYELKDGENEIKIKAKDNASNTTEKLIKVSYSL